MKETIKRLVPLRLQPVARRIYNFPMEVADRLSGRTDALTPPRHLMFVGGGNFKRSGERFKGFFIDLGGLKPQDRVLDVGCGVGRMAIPLTGYLDQQGSYEGFDIVGEGIRWCQKKITGRHPNFRFQVADLYNKTYNPTGRYRAHEYPFPYPDASFDFAILTSVFTHLLPRDTDHYVAELARVLRPGGRVFATFFLLNADSRDRIAAGESTLDFRHELERCRVQNPQIPEDAVAYDEDEVRALLGRAGFSVLSPVHFGKWCGRTEFTSYQDIVIAQKS
jgi:SAM-dependent methyltransferase